MSQFYVNSGATPPPTVATQYDADTGSAVPAANILNVFGGFGIDTSASGNTVTIALSNAGQVTAQTIGATTDTKTIITLGAIPSTGCFVSRVAGFGTDGVNERGVCYVLTAGARTDGTTATLLTGLDKLVFEDAALSGADAVFGVSGNNVQITVTGVVGYTIDWVIETNFTAS